jgi:hypothetical protein
MGKDWAMRIGTMLCGSRTGSVEQTKTVRGSDRKSLMTAQHDVFVTMSTTYTRDHACLLGRRTRSLDGRSVKTALPRPARLAVVLGLESALGAAQFFARLVLRPVSTVIG